MLDMTKLCENAVSQIWARRPKDWQLLAISVIWAHPPIRPYKRTPHVKRRPPAVVFYAWRFIYHGQTSEAFSCFICWNLIYKVLEIWAEMSEIVPWRNFVFIFRKVMSWASFRWKHFRFGKMLCWPNGTHHKTRFSFQTLSKLSKRLVN